MIRLAVDLLRSRRVLVAAVFVGTLLVSIGYLALYPSFDEQLQVFAEDLPDAYKAFIGDADISTAEGYIQSQVYSLLGPLIIAGAAIAAGSGLARSERDQTLAVFSVLPLSRRQLLGSWWLLVLLVATAGAVAAVVGVLVGGPLAGADVGLDRVLLATAPLLSFGALVGSIALLTSTLTGAPGLSSGVGWLVVLASFVANSFAELIESLRWLSMVSPWSWHGAGEAITQDFDASSFVALVGTTVVVAAAAMISFERRNLHL